MPQKIHPLGKVSLPAYDLYNVIRPLNPETKKAMFAAATHNMIKRGTWNGCAFNAGGLEVGDASISSYAKAAEVFNLPEVAVANFIRVWDQLKGTDEECTQLLREAIEKVGIYTEPNAKRATRIERKIVFKSLATQLEEIEKELAADTIENVDEMAQLLCGACA
jgi:hypothetical protein